MTLDRKLNAYVRFDGQGRVVAGSLILRRKMPKVGKWMQIQTYECCNPTTTTTTTSTTGLTTTSTSSTTTTGLTTTSTSTTSTTTTGTTTSGLTSTSTTSTSTTGSTTTAIPLCVTLGRAAEFALLAYSTITNTGSSVVTGDVGLSPGTSITGFPPGTIIGTEHITDTAAANAMIDAQAAYDCLAALTPTGVADADIGGQVFSPGVYTVASSLAITGTVTLNGGGDPNAIFVFVIGTTFIPAASAIVALTNGALPCNVWWVVGSSATLSGSSTTVGNIIAAVSVTFITSATLIGRAFALTGAVTLDTNDVTACQCTIDPCTNPPTTSTTTTAGTTSTTTTTEPITTSTTTTEPTTTSTTTTEPTTTSTTTTEPTTTSTTTTII